MTTRRSVEIGLMLMSFGSGCVDVLSFRFLGETLPSAMTGNLALLGLTLGRGDGTAAIPGLCALTSFVTGLLIGGRALRGAGRGRVGLTLGLQSVLLLGLAVAFASDQVAPWRYPLIGLAAGAMGLQSAVAHHLGAAGISTTYFTGTLASVAFTLAEKPSEVGPKLGWRLLALLLYAGGALAGGCYGQGPLKVVLAGLPFVPVALSVALTAVLMGPRSHANAA